MRCVRDYYGASATNTPAENWDAFMNALAAGPFSVPDETFTTNPLTTTSTPFIRGEGRRSGIRTTDQSKPLISMPLSAPCIGMKIEDISLVGGSMALAVSLTTASAIVMDWTLSGLYCSGQASRSISFDNPTGKPDGFFTGRLKESVMDRTVYGRFIGDRITFRDLKITGPERGIDVSSVPGARCSIVTESTIVSQGEGFFGAGLEGWVLTQNHIEHPAYLGGYTGTTGAKVVLHNTYDCSMYDNRVSASASSPGPTPEWVKADYDVIISGANWATNRVVNNSLGPCAQPSRIVNGTGVPIGGNIYN